MFILIRLIFLQLFLTPMIAHGELVRSSFWQQSDTQLESSEENSPTEVMDEITKFLTLIEKINISAADEYYLNSPKAQFDTAYNNFRETSAFQSLLSGDRQDILMSGLDAVANYIIWSHDIGAIDDLERIVEHAIEHNPNSAFAAKSLYKIYLTFREFEKAQSLRSRFKEFNLVESPQILWQTRKNTSDYHQNRSVLLASPVGKLLTEQNITLSDGLSVVVLTHPRCHFSNRAFSAIEANYELKEKFRKTAILLADPYASLSDKNFNQWNKEHPAQPIRFMTRYGDWPELNSWGTPTFYFFVDGILVRKIVGWPRGQDENRVNDLLAAYEELMQEGR